MRTPSAERLSNESDATWLLSHSQGSTPHFVGCKPTKTCRKHHGFNLRSGRCPATRDMAKDSKTVTMKRNVPEKNHWENFTELIIMLKTKDKKSMGVLIKYAMYIVEENLENINEQEEGKQWITKHPILREREILTALWYSSFHWSKENFDMVTGNISRMRPRLHLPTAGNIHISKTKHTHQPIHQDPARWQPTQSLRTEFRFGL